MVGAYLKSSIGDKEALVMLDKFITHVLVKAAPEVEPILTDKGELVVRLDSSLYICVQSAKQWNKEISYILLSISFVQILMDDCIFNKMTEGRKHMTILLHFNEMMFSCVD